MWMGSVERVDCFTLFGQGLSPLESGSRFIQELFQFRVLLGSLFDLTDSMDDRCVVFSPEGFRDRRQRHRCEFPGESHRYLACG